MENGQGTASVNQPAVPVAQQTVVNQPVQPPAVIEPQSAPVQSDRTREQIEKLVEANKRLAAELQQREQLARQYQPPAYTAPANQGQVSTQDFMETDPVTGDRYINEQRLQSRIAELNQKATQAEQTVRSYIQTAEQREVVRQNQEAFGTYPELNPQGGNFDVDFSRHTRAVIYDSLINPQDYQGRNLSFKEAADLVKSRYSVAPAATKKADENPEEVRQATEVAQTLKEQSSAAPASQSYGRPQQLDSDEDLHRRASEATRFGDDEALAWRLTKASHQGTASGEK